MSKKTLKITENIEHYGNVFFLIIGFGAAPTVLIINYILLYFQASNMAKITALEFGNIFTLLIFVSLLGILFSKYRGEQLEKEREEEKGKEIYQFLGKIGINPLKYSENQLFLMTLVGGTALVIQVFILAFVIIAGYNNSSGLALTSFSVVYILAGIVCDFIVGSTFNLLYETLNTKKNTP